MKNIISYFIITLFVVGTIDANAKNFSNTTNSAANNTTTAHTVAAAEGNEKGKEYSGKCSSSNYVYCAMAALTFVQVGLSIADALKSKKTESATACTGSYCSSGDLADGGGLVGPGVSNPDTTGVIGSTGNDDDTLGRLQNEVNGELNKLADKGYSYDPSTNSVSTPKGNIPVSTFGTTEGLKSLGLTDAEIRALGDIAVGSKNAASNSKKSNGGDAYSGGGGGLKTQSDSGDSEGNRFNMNAYLAGLQKKGSRGVAGLEKKYGSDQIGVAQDDIFKMIHRRYEAKKTTLSH